MYSHLCQYRIVERTESIEVFSIHFGSTIAPHQMIFKEDTYFRYKWITMFVLSSSYFYARHQVFLTVCTQYSDRQL